MIFFVYEEPGDTGVVAIGYCRSIWSRDISGSDD